MGGVSLLSFFLSEIFATVPTASIRRLIKITERFVYQGRVAWLSTVVVQENDLTLFHLAHAFENVRPRNSIPQVSLRISVMIGR